MHPPSSNFSAAHLSTGCSRQDGSKDDEQNSLDPTPPPKSKRRRRREVFSCDACRTRKIKCDRNLPCAACKTRDEICKWSKGNPSQTNRSEPAAELHTLRRIVFVLASRLNLTAEDVDKLGDLLTENSTAAQTDPSGMSEFLSSRRVGQGPDTTLDGSRSPPGGALPPLSIGGDGSSRSSSPLPPPTSPDESDWSVFGSPVVTSVCPPSQVGSTIMDKDVDVGSGAPSGSPYLILSDHMRENVKDLWSTPPHVSVAAPDDSFEPVEHAGSSGHWMAYPLLRSVHGEPHTSEVAFGSAESVSGFSAWDQLFDPTSLSSFDLDADHGSSVGGRKSRAGPNHAAEGFPPAPLASSDLNLAMGGECNLVIGGERWSWDDGFR